MTKPFALLSALLIGGLIIYDAPYRNAHSNDNGAPSGRTGSPGDNNSTCYNGCHGNGPGNGMGNELTTISHDIPATGYVAGSTYNVSVNMVSTGTMSFGFSLTSEDGADNKVGTLISGSDTQTTGGGNYMTHVDAPGVDSRSWDFQWVAPTAITGPVTFYTASMYGNDSGNNSGDFMVLADTSVTENFSIGVLESEYGQTGLFPNPASSEVSFGSKVLNDRISFQVFNLSGKLVQQGILEVGDNPIIELNRGLIQEGMYLVKLSDHNTDITRKLLIK